MAQRGVWPLEGRTGPSQRTLVPDLVPTVRPGRPLHHLASTKPATDSVMAGQPICNQFDDTEHTNPRQSGTLEPMSTTRPTTTNLVPRTPYTTQRAKTVPAKPRLVSKAACRAQAVRKALREDDRS